MPSAFGSAASPVHTPAQGASDDVRSAIDKRTSKSQRTVFSWLHELTPQGKIKKGHRYMMEGYDKYLDAMKFMYPEEHRQLTDALEHIVEASKKVRARKGILPKTIQVCVFGQDDFLTPEQFIALAAKFRERARTVSGAILLESHHRSNKANFPLPNDTAGSALVGGQNGINLDPSSITSQVGFNLVEAVLDADSEMEGDNEHRFGTMEEAITFIANEADVKYLGLYDPGSCAPPSEATSPGSESENELPLRPLKTMPGGFSELESFATVVFEIRGPTRAQPGS